MKVSRTLKHVIFDFDFTLLPEESSLAVINLALCGHKREGELKAGLARVTNSGTRMSPANILSMLALTRAIHTSHIHDYVATRSSLLAEDIQGAIALLRDNNVTLWLISNAYLEWVQPLALSWGFNAENIVANRLVWAGKQALCMRPSILMSGAGKTHVVRRWSARGLLGGTVVMVGDSDADRRVYVNGQVDGFVQADYYTCLPGKLPSGNAFRASRTSDLREILKRILNL